MASLHMMRQVQMPTLFKFFCFMICVISNAYIPVRHLLWRKAHVLSFSQSVSTSTSAEGSSSNNGGFDADFAEAISKPLPQWYREAKSQSDSLKQELEKNRERIIQEFRAKYEVDQSVKDAEQRKRWEEVQKRFETRKKQNWFQKAFSNNKVLDKEVDKTTTTTTTDIDDSNLSTKEKWDKFWKEEEEQTGIALPSLLEAFPELEFKWPKWAKRKDGTAIECETDSDCPFPLACCAHPIIPGQKFCCSGWGQRMMVYAYAGQEISPDRPPSTPDGSSGGIGGSNGGGGFSMCSS